MKLAKVALFAVLLLFLGLVMTYPMIMDIAHSIPGPPGDNFEYVYKLWWFKSALLEQHRSPFLMPQVFYPFGYEVALSETTLSNTILALPVTSLAGEVVAYNALLLWSFVLSGAGAFLFARYLTGSSVAGVIAGLTFALLPYRLSNIASGHLPLLGTGWLPFFLLYVERLIRRKRLRDGLLAGLFYALFALSSWYYAYAGALVAVLYTLLRGKPWRTCLMNRRFWLAALAGAGLALLIMSPALLSLLGLSLQGEIARTTLSLRYVDQWSASLLDFLLPSVMHPLWGDSIVALYPQNVHENLLFLGFVPLVLAAYALLRRRTNVAGAVVDALGAVGFVAVVLALGTTVHWAGQPVYVPVPAALESVFSRVMYAVSGKYALNPASYASMQQAGQIVIPLPTLALYLFLPFFNAMRVWTRFGLVVGLVTAILAGIGAAGVLRWPRWTHRSRLAIGLLFAAGIVFEFATVPYPFGVSAVGAQPVDEWLKNQPGDFAILELPVAKTWHGPALYAQREHGKPIAYGYGTYMPSDYRAWQQRLANFPDQESLDAIREAGIRYVLVGLHSYGDAEQAMRDKLQATPQLHLVTTLDERPVLRGDRLISRVAASPLVPPTELIGGTRFAYLADEIAVYELVH